MDLSDLINVMVQQELSIYKTQDYLQPEFQEKIALQSVKDFPMLSNFSVGSSSSSSSSPINEFWREKICEWSFQVVDHFNFSREVVCVSIHMLDRFLSTRSVDKNTFQLAAMTTLFVSIKLSEPGRLSMRSMIELSRGYFKVEQMVAMEMTILRSLSWQIHPPTAYCFLKHLLFLPTFHCVPMEMRYDVLELSRFLTELSVMDYFFVIYRPSSVAIAALLIAMEANPGVTRTRLSDFSKEIGKLNHLDTRCKEVLDCRNRIRLLYVDGGYADNQAIRAQESRTETISPVCVSYGCTTYPDFA